MIGFRKKILLLMLLVSISLPGLIYYYSADLKTPQPHEFPNRIINIAKGSTPDQIISLLASKGIIKNELLLKLYVRITNAGKLLKAGDYIFDSPISPAQVIEKLTVGEPGVLKLTIVEGWNRWDVASAMTKIQTLHLSSSKNALALIADTSLIRDLDSQALSLEGYMFPSTYLLLSNDTPETVVAQMVAQFKTIWKQELLPIALNHREKLNIHKIVTIASIIETEAKKKEERPLIASVIYNRLHKNMPLGMDSTLVYASKLAGKWHNDGKVYQSDIDRESPYNTRKRIGLPIGPVGNPGVLSLKAALQPAKTDFIYYVRNPFDNSGSHNFYSNAAAFEKGVQALRDWEAKRDHLRKGAG
jgi:UPF0755 protein